MRGIALKMFDLNGKFVSVDVRPSSYPIRGVSKSKLQGLTAEKLQELYPLEPLLEEFNVPGSKMTVDFFLPKMGLIVEVDGIQHDQHSPFFHGDRRVSKKYAGQIYRDNQKEVWAENNGFRIVRVKTEKDLEELANA